MGPGSQDKTGAPRDKDHTSVIKEGCLEEGSEKGEPSPCPLFVGVCDAVHTCGRADPRGHTSQTRARGRPYRSGLTAQHPPFSPHSAGFEVNGHPSLYVGSGTES